MTLHLPYIFCLRRPTILCSWMKTVKRTGKKLYPLKNVNAKKVTVIVGVNIGDAKNAVYHVIYQN